MSTRPSAFLLLSKLLLANSSCSIFWNNKPVVYVYYYIFIIMVKLINKCKGRYQLSFTCYTNY